LCEVIKASTAKYEESCGWGERQEQQNGMEPESSTALNSPKRGVFDQKVDPIQEVF
jgi:hypothetical protein